MSHLSDEAVVVRLTEYSETSQIVTLFGAQHGLVRLIAKGSRRGTRQRFAAGFDLLELGSVTFLPPRGDAQLGTLTEWVQRDTFSGARRELLRLYGATYAVELVAQLTEEADPHPELYEALVETLRGLAGDGPAGPLVPAFQRSLLRAIGYAPDLDNCVSCGRAIGRSGILYFSAGAGGILCRDCEGHHVEKMRVAPQLAGDGSGGGDPRGWFELFDYHLTHIAGRRFRTADQLAVLLGK